MEAFKVHFCQVGTEKRAVGEKRYLKSNLQFYGVNVPGIRKAAVAFAKDNPDLSRAASI